MARLLISDSSSLDTAWAQEVAKHRSDIQPVLLSDLDVSDQTHLDGIDYALIWKPKPGLLASMRSLKLIVSIGAGIDHLQSDPLLPKHVPITRMVDPGLSQGMAEYAVWSCLSLQRRMLAVRTDTAQAKWRQQQAPLASSQTVGILGYGTLGSVVANALSAIGFQVLGWSRSAKPNAQIPTYSGSDGLAEMLPRCDLIFAVLPATQETHGLVDAKFLAQCKAGFGLVNAGRGSLINQHDLLSGLDNGHVSGAILDVFDPEPLPSEHPYWHHPNVWVTPHIAALTYPQTGVAHVLECIDAVDNERPLPQLVDWDQGY